MRSLESSFPLGRYVEKTARTGVYRGRVGVIRGYSTSGKSVRVLLGGDAHPKMFRPEHLRTMGRRPETPVAVPETPPRAAIPRFSESVSDDEDSPVVQKIRIEKIPVCRTPSTVGTVSDVDSMGDILAGMDFSELLAVHRLLHTALSQFDADVDSVAASDRPGCFNKVPLPGN